MTKRTRDADAGECKALKTPPHSWALQQVPVVWQAVFGNFFLKDIINTTLVSRAANLQLALNLSLVSKTFYAVLGPRLSHRRLDKIEGVCAKLRQVHGIEIFKNLFIRNALHFKSVIVAGVQGDVFKKVFLGHNDKERLSLMTLAAADPVEKQGKLSYLYSCLSEDDRAGIIEKLMEKIISKLVIVGAQHSISTDMIRELTSTLEVASFFRDGVSAGLQLMAGLSNSVTIAMLDVYNHQPRISVSLSGSPVRISPCQRIKDCSFGLGTQYLLRLLKISLVGGDLVSVFWNRAEGNPPARALRM